MAAERAYQRLLGRYAGTASGPLLIVMAGIHGNEPAGVEAAGRVLARLQVEQPPARGEVVAVAGNLVALGRNERFIDKDLNRVWTPERLAALGREATDDDRVEDRQQRELVTILERLLADARGPVIFLDLHTTSADGPPFLTIGDTLRNRAFAMRFPLPVILGLEEQVDGALLEHLNNFGAVTMGVEAGQHRSAASVQRLEAVLWLALAHTGMIGNEAVPGLEARRRELADVSRSVPRVIEVRYRHSIAPGDGFRMEPGLRNFCEVRRGQVLARDNNGPIGSPEDGLILLPLYQGRGDDGFFVGREVRMFWLRLSALLRRMRVTRLIPLLPGVRRETRRPELLVVDTRIARWYSMEFFHLFGFRKLRRRGTELRVSRRVYDLAPPDRFAS